MAKEINGHRPAGKLWTHDELIRALSDVDSAPKVLTKAEWIAAGHTCIKWIADEGGYSYRQAAKMIDKAIADGTMTTSRVLVRKGDVVRSVLLCKMME